VQQKALDNTQLSFEQLTDVLTQQIFRKSYGDAYFSAIQSQLKEIYLNSLFELHANNKTTASVKAISFGILKGIESDLKKAKSEPYKEYYLNKIKRFLANPDEFEVQETPVLPDGSPIGSDAFCSQFKL
jgi:ribosome biogenesis GTPase A